MSTETFFLRNVVSHSGSTVIGSVLQLLLVLFLARFLTITDFSYYVTAVALIGVCEMAVDFGGRVWGVREFSIRKDIEKTVANLIPIKFLFTFLSAIIIWFVPIQFLNPFDKVCCTIIAATQPSNDPFLWRLRSKNRLDLEAVVNLVWRISVVMVIALAVFVGMAIEYFLLIWIAVNLGRLFFESMSPRVADVRQASLKFPWVATVSHAGSILKEMLPVGAAFVLMALYQRLGVLLLGYRGTEKDVAMYGAAFVLISSSVFIASSVTATIYPSLSRKIDNDEHLAATALVNKNINIISWLFGLTIVLGGMIAPWVVTIIYGDSYREAGVIILLLLPGLYATSLNLALKFILNAYKKNFKDLISVLIAITVFLAITLFVEDVNIAYVFALAWAIGETVMLLFKKIMLVRVPQLAGVSINFSLLMCLVVWIASLAVFGYRFA